MVHNLSGFYFLFPFSMFLAKARGKRSIEKPFYYFLFFRVGCTAMFYSTQGSAQPQDTRRERERAYHLRVPHHFSWSIFSLFLFIGFCSFISSFMTNSWVRLMVLKVEPTTFFSTKKYSICCL